MLRLTWCDGEECAFHFLWLRDNCAATRHSSSRQKLISAAELPAGLRPASAKILPDEDVLQVVWEPDMHESAFSAAWLRSFSDETRPLRYVGSPAKSLPQFSFSALNAGESKLRAKWLCSLHQCGAILVQGAPCERHTVKQVAEWIGPLQNQIYGETWDVISSDNAINIAYTGEYLGPHMDLCYYESPPGIQLLHCMEFHPEVVGGDSFLIDAFQVAEELRETNPQAFMDLTRIPATFVKDHSDRAEPVRPVGGCPTRGLARPPIILQLTPCHAVSWPQVFMSYQRPHISLNAQGDVIGVFWSPPFEGPLRARGEDVPRYYAAYKTMHDAISNAPMIRHRLEPGQILIFNNRRMLHGRAAFTMPACGGKRWMRGCYVNIDDFANKVNISRRKENYPDEGDPPGVPYNRVGNQDWSSGRAIGIP